MNSKDELSVYGYIRQNFEQKSLIHEIITTIIQFFRNKGGLLFVCGDGGNGRLGIKEFYDKDCKKPTRVQSVEEIVDIAVYSDHTMAVDHEGRVLAFGNGYDGQLGTGDWEYVIVPKQLALNQRAIAVSVGNMHSLILVENGYVLSCGESDWGQLGHGNGKSRSVPKIIIALKRHKITQISAGHQHSGALSENGDLFMWGDNNDGQCGVGEDRIGEKIMKPTMVKFKGKVSVIECGTSHSLLISFRHSLYSFGCGDEGQLGIGAARYKCVPTLIESLKKQQITNVAGGGCHTLCVDDESNVWAFGMTRCGQCGRSKNIFYGQTTPKKMEYFTANNIKAKEVAAGHNSSCVITQNNECFVFGDNDNYQIGLQEKTDHFVPTKLPFYVQKVSMGMKYSAFIGDYKKK